MSEDKPFSREDVGKLAEYAREHDVRTGGYLEEGVRCIMFWAGPDNHPDHWDDAWEFFHGDKELYPEKRAFVGWVGAAGWSRDGDDGFDHFELRSRNIQALKVHRDSTDWQTTEYRSRHINREEDLQWLKEMFLELFHAVFPDREDPEITVNEAAKAGTEDFPSYLQPSTFEEA